MATDLPEEKNISLYKYALIINNNSLAKLPPDRCFPI